MPDPITARIQMTTLFADGLIDRGVETPIVIWLAKLYGTCGVNCLAYHDDKVLNALTRQRPLLPVPEFGHNSFSRMMCTAQCYALVATLDGLAPIPRLERLFREWGLDAVIQVKDDLFNAAIEGNLFEILQIALESDYHPLVMGQLVFLEIVSATVLDNADGWNAIGLLTYDVETDTVVPCTHNCAFFADTTGYFPRNVPRKRSADEDKYVVNGTDRYWQPLLEHNGEGYFSRQEHVTPHIGLTAKPELRPLGEIPDPEYDYYEEALLVIEEMRRTTNDPERQRLIKFFDNKLYVRGLIQEGMKMQFGNAYSFEDELLFIHGLDLVEYDALLNAWKEKRRHDLVRPTTVIQRWGDDIIGMHNSSEDFRFVTGSNENGTVFRARDFQAFIRVMPHSEYPSGSGCLCTAYADFTQTYTDAYYCEDLVNLTVGPNSLNFGCDGDFLSSLGCDEDWFTIPDMATLRDVCGESRLWGGMHFRASVPNSYALCQGLGPLALAVIDQTRNGSNFTNVYYQGDPLPTCTSKCPGETNE